MNTQLDRKDVRMIDEISALIDPHYLPAPVNSPQAVRHRASIIRHALESYRDNLKQFAKDTDRSVVIREVEDDCVMVGSKDRVGEIEGEI